MKVTLYDPTTEAVLDEAITGLDFGTVFQGNHSDLPMLIRPSKTDETAFEQIMLFLQNDGGLTQSSFGYRLNAVISGGVPAGNAYLSDHFVRTASPSLTGEGGVAFNAASPEYMWLDVEIGGAEKGQTDAVNFQFLYEFN